MSSSSRIQLENWLKALDIKGSVLDVGGSQNPIKGRTKSWKVSEYKILDLAQPHQGNKPEIICDLNYACMGDTDGHLDVYEQDEDSKDSNCWGNKILERPLFDNAFCIEVSEYWFNPTEALQNINAALKQNGLLYISFHTLYGLHNPKGEDCLRYTNNAIKKLMDESGFEIIEIIPRTISEEGRQLLERFYRVEGMRLDFSDPATYHEGYLVKARKI